MSKFEVIVVGSGHAGVEAATAAARMGCQTLLLTMSADQISTMSCNPAVGGLGKSHLAQEVDALGGSICQVADQSAMQYRVLNEKKGPAVRATRVQVDRHEYRALMKCRVENLPNLHLKQAQVSSLIIENNQITGVVSTIGQKFFASAIVITTGTFMNGKAHVGKVNFSSGRAGEGPSIGLSDFLKSLGIRVGRLKTGTVPRVDARTINWDLTEEQVSDKGCMPLSYFTKELRNDLESAHLVNTNDKTHEIIRASLHESPLYSGIIESRGPRYCPSVEDKIVRFGNKNSHQVFLEKEGRSTNEVYVGGVSTSLPYECQINFLRSIPALQNVEIVRPGYAIEYDFIDATQLKLTLELKDLEGLFFAGQVNGTSGYEEAAAQGILAGINAAARCKNLEPLILNRAEAYLGVLVDDLTTHEAKEPYRMFCSRAEYRLLLREDNVLERLSPIAYKYGLIDSATYDGFMKRKVSRETADHALSSTRIFPDQETNAYLETINESPLKNVCTAKDLLKRPGITLQNLTRFLQIEQGLDERDIRNIETNIKYEGYVQQSMQQISKVKKMDDTKIFENIDYHQIAGLSNESVEKLVHHRPTTLGQAARIQGVTPATISILAIYLSGRKDNLTRGLKFGRNKETLIKRDKELTCSA